MDCHQAELLISPYLDGELSGGDKAMLEEHLGKCRACSVLATQTVQGNKMMSGYIQALNLTGNITDNTLAAIRQNPIYQKRPSYAWAFEFAKLAASVMAVILAYRLIPASVIHGPMLPFAGAGLAMLGIGLVFVLMSREMVHLNNLLLSRLAGATLGVFSRDSFVFRIWGMVFTLAGFLVTISF